MKKIPDAGFNKGAEGAATRSLARSWRHKKAATSLGN